MDNIQFISHIYSHTFLFPRVLLTSCWKSFFLQHALEYSFNRDSYNGNREGHLLDIQVVFCMLFLRRPCAGATLCHFSFHDTVLNHDGLFNGINSQGASRLWRSHDVNGPTHRGVTAEQQQNMSHYLKGGTRIMHNHYSTFKIKGFNLYAVNTVSFTSFQWQHNGSRQRHG